MVDLSGDTSLKTQFAGAESKFWGGLAPTWKFKVGRFFERVVFGAVRSFLFFLAKVYFNFQVDSSKHSIIIPEFTYSPWLADKNFQKIWSNIPKFQIFAKIFHFHMKNPILGQNLPFY